MNPRSRHYARRAMFAARRRLLGVLKEAVWQANYAPLYADHYDNRDDTDHRAYYYAREMAHWGRRALR